jgi:quercetin dioxygenase-like cupin family protein
MTVRKADDVPRESVGAGQGTEKQVLIGAEEGHNFAMRRFIMQPGGGMPKHTNTIEHEQYVLRGRARVGIGEKVHHVSEGSVLYIPAGTPHWYEAQGDEPFEFLCMVPNHPEDHIELVE